jgi:effector-binding domain-containing protein
VSEIPAGECAVAIHQRPYDMLSRRTTAIYRWIEENGGEHAGPQGESYLDPPEDQSPLEAPS